MNASIERLIKNLCNARRSWEVWCFMSGLNNNLKQVNREVRQKVEDDKLLFHLRYLAMKDYYIELYKVLKKSTNNKDNIFKLLESNLEISSPEKKVLISEAIDGLTSANEIISDVCNVRDKFYAHLDHDYESYISRKSYVKDTLHLFCLIESGIIALTSKDVLVKHLNKIPSWDEYTI